MLAADLSIALKEWAVTCSALESGKQILLLRKGGIYESAGEFEIEHRQFLLFPTYLHQNPAMLKPQFHPDAAQTSEPAAVRISCAAEITDIIPMPTRALIDALEDEHIWTRPLIDMRFNYRPENPLFLLLVRAYLLPQPIMIPNTPAYAGCKSWVPLNQAIQTQGAKPVLDDAKYSIRHHSILQKINRNQGNP